MHRHLEFTESSPRTSYLAPRHLAHHPGDHHLEFIGNYYSRKRITKNMDSLSQFVEQLSTETSSAVPPPTGFPLAEGFNDNYTGALKWRDLIQDTIYQVKSARSINTQHGTLVILYLQTAEGFCFNACACGMLTKELLQSPSMLEDKQTRLFVRPTGPKKSKNSRIYHLYQLLQC